MLTIGLTGDVGAGKSTLCRVWREMGAEVFDADTIARDMWKLPDVQRRAEARWGEGFFNGGWKEVCSRIAAKIFTDEAEYEFASSLLHAATMAEIERRVSESRGWCVAEIPLLFECGRPKWIDKVVFAAAPFEKRVERNSAREWNADEVRRRDAKLMPREEKIARSDWLLENSGTVEEWEEKARKLGAEIREMAEEW